MGSILVTGCSGLVGTYLTHSLLRRGYRVIGVDINYSKFLPSETDFHFERMDFRKPCMSRTILSVKIAKAFRQN